MSVDDRASRARRRRRYRYAKWAVPVVAIGIVAAFLIYGNRMTDQPGGTLHILTGTENRILFDDPNSDQPAILERFEQEHGVDLVPTFQGSVDTMLDLQQGASNYDAIWPASSIWLDLGDKQDVLSSSRSIMSTPVVFAVKRSKAEELGWIGKDVSVDDILAAAESGQLDFLMSSASQSNSGAMAYLGFLSAFAGHPDVLTSEMLHDPAVQEKVTRLLGSVDRTAGSSGFLRDLLVENYADYDGMVNNESAVITANQRLTEQGESDLLYVVYPVDGLAIADWPLAFIDRNVEGRDELFAELQDYLLSEEVQHELLAQGRRTTGIGSEIDPNTVDPEVFNPEWGIDVTRPLDPFTLPAADVILESLDLYQTAFRKPSRIVFCLDFSDSMEGDGEAALKEAMSVLLDPETAAQYFLQRTDADVTIVAPFNDSVKDALRVDGNNATRLTNMLGQIQQLDASGGTNMYNCLQYAQTHFPNSPDGSAPAVVLMTDGKSNKGSLAEFQAALPSDPDAIVPVYAVLFGNAERDQLEQIVELTNGAIYDGRDGLIQAMRDAFANA